jgi:hypothetical protein
MTGRSESDSDGWIEEVGDIRARSREPSEE